MDDNEHVCPLCCEELDISDQKFFPCKCGYQVCMWCWHRIRESESGLCPACRTPYGDDPHQFSAVDVQEVLKANKEKEAAAKREQDRQRNSDNFAAIAAAGGHITKAMQGEDGETLTGIMEVPKDRTQLANMRVIRRNLVYAVGLPASLANEDLLRRADYFGQYGKIAKIVLNRNQAQGDPRRATCSAYVTFVYKEDTLACILAMDGFSLDYRAVRASYGTSKYCSAFIKNVRCNNPECTYLHEMGAVEDTFTKQEIQAGYVTSGRDVLARQQQIVQQALSASQGLNGVAPRRRIGAGGPSGTGKAATHPVFPVPEFDEPAKPAPAPVPAAASMARAVSTGSGFPTPAAAAAQQQAALAAKPISRSASVGVTPKPTLAASVARKIPPGVTLASAAAAASDGPLSHAKPGATAASVVAGGRSTSGGLGLSSSSTTTLTPLTPLKRTPKTSSSGVKAASTADTSTLSMPTISNAYPKPKASLPRGNATKSHNDALRGTTASASAPGTSQPSTLASATSNTSSGVTLTSLNRPEQQQPSSLSALGGEVIAAPDRSKLQPIAPVGAIGSSFGGPSRGNVAVGPSALNGLGGGNDILAGGAVSGRPVGLSGLGGEVFTGPLSSPGPKSAIGSGKDKWGASNQFTGSGALNSVQGQPIGAPGGFWRGPGGGSNLQGMTGSTIGAPGLGGIGGGVIGPPGAGHPLSNAGAFGGASNNRNQGSSALASILGINLPTGSGTLGESRNLWPQNSMQQPHQPGPISSRHGVPMPSQGIIGRSNGSSGLIGGVPIGGNPIGMGGGVANQQGPIGGSNKNDIALLQSLLPEVHITSGNPNPPNGWNGGRPRQQPVGPGVVGSVGAVGTVGRGVPQQAQPQGNLNIW